jgi:hypothetical protein
MKCLNCAKYSGIELESNLKDFVISLRMCSNVPQLSTFQSTQNAGDKCGHRRGKASS